jgi:hypothetical protein
MKFIATKNPADQRSRGSLKKIILLMKLTTFLLILALVQAAAKGYSQVTLHEKNAPFEKVLTSIKKQTGYTFFYDERITAGRITVDVDNASIPQALDKCFLGLPITYKIIDNNIFLKEKEAIKPPAVVTPTQITPVPPATISGTILNEDKKPVEGASVHVKGTSIGTKTNANGYFRLFEITDSAVLRITSIGYLPVELGIHKVKNGYKVYAIDKTEAENLKSGTGEDVVFTLRLISSVGVLAVVSIKADIPKQIGTIVDLTHRTQLNLGQVLEGSVPGLTLQNSTTISQELNVNVTGYGTGLDGTYTGTAAMQTFYNNLIKVYPFYLSIYSTFDAFYNYYYSLQGQSNTGINVISTTSSNGLIPQLEGSSSFTGNTSGMLVVIDGVPQSSFPANYPMSNVASVEVVRDPAELVKWGPNATGSSSFYYSGRPDISNATLQLVSCQINFVCII